MEIKVRVLNGSTDKKEEEKERQPVILTTEYVKSLNRQIEYNTQARELSTTPDSLSLKRIIC